METLDTIFKIAFIIWVVIYLFVRPYLNGFFRELFRDLQLEQARSEADRVGKIHIIQMMTGAPLNMIYSIEQETPFTFDDAIEFLSRGGQFNDLFKY